MSLFVSWLTTASRTFSRSNSCSATSTETTSSHTGSMVFGTARVAARLGNLAAASRIVFAATNAAGGCGSPLFKFVAPWTRMLTRTVLPAPLPSRVATWPDPPASVSSIVTCKLTWLGARPSGCSKVTVMETASPRASRSTVAPKNSTYPCPINTSWPITEWPADRAPYSWHTSAGGPSPNATPSAAPPSVTPNPGQSLPSKRSSTPVGCSAL